MRNFIYIFLIIIAFSSCKSKNRSEEIANYAYDGHKIEMNQQLTQKVGSWIEEKKTCYGIVIMFNTDKKVVSAKPVKAKVLFIQNDKIKMKALEDVSLAPKEGCSKMGISKGDTWWEEDGDLFQTREEAVAFIKSIISKKKAKTGSKFTIDK